MFKCKLDEYKTLNLIPKEYYQKLIEEKQKIYKR